MEAQGHDAWSCDLLAASGKHIQGDVRTVLNRGWDLAIFHPPCTYLCNSGVRWLYGGKGKTIDPVRWEEFEKATAFFNDLQNADIPSIALENPIPHGFATERIGDYDQVVQPFNWGDPDTKRTCLWLKNLPPLVKRYETWEDCRIALCLPEGAKPKPTAHYAAPGPERWKLRSTTYPGIAQAMTQWSDYARH